VSDQPTAPSDARSRARSRTAQRRAEPAEVEEADLSGAWRNRPWVPVSIMGVLIAVVLGTGLLMDQALKAPTPSALAGCITSTQTGPHTFIGPQPICILPTRKYVATINTTQGKIVVRLHPEIAPVTVNNFVVLATHGYYNGLTFWDAQSWEVQTGDPKGNGTGGPGYSLPDEPNFHPSWASGALGMARVPGGAVNGSQFFIEKGSWPDKGATAVYNRFGTVISGLSTVQLLTTSDRITSITISVT
jgi:cyclophilin family peptidyl-prolyl cis-trans isomerase